MGNLHKFIQILCANSQEREKYLKTILFRRMIDMILEQIKNPDSFGNSEQNMIYFLQEARISWI